MNNEYKEMLERFDQICQNAKKELLCAKEENDKEQEINRLNNIIDEAIKFIENYDWYYLELKKTLLDILKGDNK